MKKILLTLFALVVVFTASARHDVELKSGSLKSLQGKSIYIAFDYSKMMIYDEDTQKTMTETEFCQMKGEDWVRDQGKDTEEAEAYFIKTMKEKATTVNIVEDASAADFVVTVIPHIFSYGNPNPLAAFKSILLKTIDGFFTGEIIVTDKDGNDVAKLYGEKIMGEEPRHSWTIAKNYVYINTAKSFIKSLKKAK